MMVAFKMTEKIDLATLKHVQNIIDASESNRLAVFIGAGFSKNGNKTPSWSELINELKNDLGGIEGEQDSLKIAQYYFMEFGEHSYYTRLKQFIPETLIPSEQHKQLFSINVNYIITTNWDNLLEKEVYENGYLFDVIACDEDLAKSTLQKKIIKIHGDFNHHNIVFKEDDYLNYSRNFPLIENYIKSILSTHVVLFIGYSYSDINIKKISKWRQSISKVAPPHYMFSSKNKTTAEAKYLENNGITVLYEEKRYCFFYKTISY
jgi:NAD-dependent SIR2 family protein deacetylase